MHNILAHIQTIEIYIHFNKIIKDYGHLTLFSSTRYKSYLMSPQKTLKENKCQRSAIAFDLLAFRPVNQTAIASA